MKDLSVETFNTAIQAVIDRTNSNTDNYDKFISKSLYIAKRVENSQKEKSRAQERIVRNCIAASLPALNEPKTSVSDIGKYAFTPPPTFYGLNLYMMIIPHLGEFYLGVDPQTRDLIAPSFDECLNLIEMEIEVIRKTTLDKDLLNLPELSQNFQEYNDTVAKLRSLIEPRSNTDSVDIVKEPDIPGLIAELREDHQKIQESIDLSSGYIEDIQMKSNRFYKDWKENKREQDAERYISDTGNMLNGLTQLAGLIVNSIDMDEEVKAYIECSLVIMSAGLNIGIAVILTFATGGVAFIGIGAALVGGVTSIVGFFLNMEQKSPEEKIFEQISFLGEMISDNFKALFSYLNDLEQTIVKGFMDIRGDIRQMNAKMFEIERNLSKMLDIILDSEYYNNRNMALSYHDNFSSDMPYELQVESFYNFYNCATIKSKEKSKHLSEGLVAGIEGIKEHGIDQYISFLAEYAHEYLAAFNPRAIYVTPTYWAEGCLSLVEYILRTPEFEVLDKQKASIDRLIEIGRRTNDLSAELYQNNVLAIIINKYMQCLDDMVPFNSRQSGYRITTTEKWQEALELERNYISKAYESPVLKRVEEYRVLIDAYFRLLMPEAYNGSEMVSLVKSLWGENEFKRFYAALSKSLPSRDHMVREYEKLKAVKCRDQIMQASIYLRNKFCLFRNYDNAADELSRICRVLLNYAETKREAQTVYPLVENICTYLEKFENEFFHDDESRIDTRCLRKIKSSHMDYFYMDFGNTLDFSFRSNFSDKSKGVKGKIEIAPNTSNGMKFEPWKIMDGSWIAHPELAGIEGEVGFVFTLPPEGASTPLYLRLSSRLVDVYTYPWDEKTLGQKITLHLKNNTSDHIIESGYRPAPCYIDSWEPTMDGNWQVSPLCSRHFRDDVWVLPLENLSAGENRIVLRSKYDFMIHNIELASDYSDAVTPVDNSTLYCINEDKYIGIEMGGEDTKLILKSELDETCFFSLKYLKYSNLFELHSTLLNDRVAITQFYAGGLAWSPSFNIMPLENLKKLDHIVADYAQRNTRFRKNDISGPVRLALPVVDEQDGGERAYINVYEGSTGPYYFQSIRTVSEGFAILVKEKNSD